MNKKEFKEGVSELLFEGTLTYIFVFLLFWPVVILVVIGISLLSQL